jgi:hypothetical protein
MRRLITAILAVLLLAGPSASAAAAPVLSVATPADGAIISDSSFTVTFQVANFQIVQSTVPLAEAGKHPEVNRPGEGHLHFILDLQPLVTWYQDTPYTFTNVPPGEHQLMVEVVENDHSSLNPRVMQMIRITETPLMPATGGGGGRRSPVGGIGLGVAMLMLGCGALLWKRRVHSDQP